MSSSLVRGFNIRGERDLSMERNGAVMEIQGEQPSDEINVH